MLCNFCLSIFKNPTGGTIGDVDRRRNTTAWEQAALSNCLLCHALLAKYNAWGNDLDAEPDQHVWLSYKFDRPFPSDDALILGVDMYGPPLDDPNRRSLASRRSGEQMAAFMLLPSGYIDPPPPAFPQSQHQWTVGNEMGNSSEAQERNPPRDDDGDAASRPTNTGDLDLTLLARRWLVDCEQNHSACNAGREVDWAPKRLLYLGMDPADRPKLIETAIHAQPKNTGRWAPTRRHRKYRYATVSYCWGTDPDVLKLSDTTMDELRAGMPIHRFPLSLRQAIKTARRLGISHVWIDSVCILQAGPGSADDWQEQAGQMKRVYANAVLNIGASCSPSAKESIFVHRETRLLEPLVVEFSPPAERHSAGKDAAPDIPARREFHVLDFDAFGYQFSTWPAGSRGWIFQERQLARRMLHFGPEQLHWECKGRPHANEVYPGGYRAPEKWMSDFRVTPFSVDNESGTESGTGDRVVEDETRVFNTAWGTIATAYSRLQLTYPDTDKLVALSGVAERVARSRSDRYVAGIFSSMLPAALMWRAAGKGGDSAKSGSGGIYRAPSWSWMSKDLPIVYNMAVYQSERSISSRVGLTVEKIRVDLVDSSNPFGRLQSASLTVKGSLVTVVAKRLWKRRDRSGNAEVRKDGDGDEEEAEDADDAASDPFSATVALEIQTSRAGMIECFFGLDDELTARRLRERIAAGESPKVLVLPIYEKRTRPSEDLLPGQTEETETTAGLVLEADTAGDGEASPVYRRLGLFSANALILDDLTSIQDQTTLVLV